MPFIIYIVTFALGFAVFAGLLGYGPFADGMRKMGKAVLVITGLVVMIFLYQLTSIMSWGWSVLFFVLLAGIAIPIIKVRSNRV